MLIIGATGVVLARHAAEIPFALLNHVLGSIACKLSFSKESLDTFIDNIQGSIGCSFIYRLYFTIYNYTINDMIIIT